MDSSFALRLFVAIARERNFSAGASVCAVPQSTASRRIARLEEELGGRLFTRTTRVVTLTSFGTDVFAAAVELLAAESEFHERVATARNARLRLLLPPGLPDGEIAAMTVKAEARGLRVTIDAAPLQDRRNALRTRAADAVLLPATADEADWSAPLGFASSDAETASSLSLSTLRPHRDDPPDTWTSIVLLPDDAETAVRSRLEEHAVASGLAAQQLRATTRVSEALAIALAGDGLLCCTRTEARRWGLAWQPPADLPLARSLVLHCRDENERSRVRNALGGELDALFGDTGAHPRKGG